MKHYIKNITFAILTFVGIVLGSVGSEILLALFGIKFPALFTLIIGLALAWLGAVSLIRTNTDWISNYGGE